jgi:hypothetical protein
VIALLRTWRGRFIIAMVASQLLLPLHYYLARRDKHDERFAWRMFSPMRAARCQPSFWIDGRSIEIESQFHEAWVELALRGRFVIVEAMGAKLCADHPGSVVRVLLSCTYLDHDPISYGGFDICKVPEL